MDRFEEPLDAGGTDEAATIQIFVQHGGNWVNVASGSKFYNTSKETEIMDVPRDCTFKNLVDMVLDLFKLSPTRYRLRMTYGFKTSLGIVVLGIKNDGDVLNFLRFNMKIDTITPLCLLIDGEPYDFCLPSELENRECADANLCVSMHAQGSSKGSSRAHVQLEVPAGGDEDFEEARGNECVDECEVGGQSSSSNDGSGEAHIINEEDLSPNVNDDGSKSDPNFDVGDGVIVNDFRGSMGSSTGIDIGASSVVIEKNQLFSSKMELRRHVCLHAIRHKFEFKISRSTRHLFVANCIGEGCKWKVRASKLAKSEYFKVGKFIPTHTCSRDVVHHDHRHAGSWVISHYIKSRYEGVGRAYKPKDIIQDMWREFGVNISYEKAWRARESALDSIRGSLEESFTILPSYCAMLESKNPGSVTDIQTDANNHFKYFFMSMWPCIKGFYNSIRPVIAINGTLLRAKYLGRLFIATCLDGNNQVYPIAFGIGDAENDTSWEWFIMKLREVISEVEDLAFVSELNSGIEKAIKKVFPHSIYSICIYHLRQNLKSKFKNNTLISLFNAAAKVTCMLEFDKLMREITKCDVNAAMYLTEVGVHRWARAHFDARRYNIVTNNIAECLNAILKDIKELPINMLIDHLRGLVQNWFYERRTAAANMKSFLTDWAESQIQTRMDMSEHFRVHPIDCYEMEVFDGERNSLVNLHSKTCSCREFDLDQLPCAHALAAARYCHTTVNGLCSHFYTTSSLVDAYAESIYPVGHMEDWKVPDDVKSRVVLPPLSQSSEGKRKYQTSLKSKDQKMRKCGRCQGIGHNRQKCKEPFPFHPQKGATSS